MGDRGNLGFKQYGDGECVWLYTHWTGAHLPGLARTAVEAGRPRWGDATYATRLALTAIIGREEGATGWGVSTRPDDNEHDLLVIDWDKSTVTVHGRGLAAEWWTMDPQQRAEALASGGTPVPFAELDQIEEPWN